MLPGKKGSEAKNPGNRVSPPPPAPPPPKISKKQISEVRKRYGLSEEEAYEAFFNEGFSAGQEAGKEQGKYDYAALNLVLENVEERTGQEISSLKMDMKILNADLRNEKQLTGIYEDKLAEAQDNLRITTIICENAINEREAERKKIIACREKAKELRSRKQGSEECLNCKEGSKGGRRITSIIMDECANLQPHQIEQMKKLSLGVDMAQGKDKTISPTLLERIEKQRNEILNKKGPDADLRLWMNAKTFCFLEKEDIVAHSIETGKLESLFGMPIVIDAAISDMGFMVIRWQPDEGK